MASSCNINFGPIFFLTLFLTLHTLLSINLIIPHELVGWKPAVPNRNSHHAAFYCFVWFFVAAASLVYWISVVSGLTWNIKESSRDQNSEVNWGERGEFLPEEPSNCDAKGEVHKFSSRCGKNVSILRQQMSQNGEQFGGNWGISGVGTEEGRHGLMQGSCMRGLVQISCQLV